VHQTTVTTTTPPARAASTRVHRATRPTAKQTTTAATHATTNTATHVTTVGTSSHPSRPPKPTAKKVTISDTFDGDQIDGTIWYQIREGSGWDFTEQDGHLEFSFGPGTTPGPNGNDGGHVGTLCKFPGDFDARVAASE